MHPVSTTLKTYHILCTIKGSPALLKVDAGNTKQALQLASAEATNLIQLFVTRQKRN